MSTISDAKLMRSREVIDEAGEALKLHPPLRLLSNLTRIGALIISIMSDRAE
jgi:hypothetical protein